DRISWALSARPWSINERDFWGIGHGPRYGARHRKMRMPPMASETPTKRRTRKTASESEPIQSETIVEAWNAGEDFSSESTTAVAAPKRTRKKTTEVAATAPEQVEA